jgi:hypothetical protein
MPYPDFNEIKYVYVTDTGTINQLGYAVSSDVKELEFVRLDFYKHGTEVGDEQFRLNIYTDSAYSQLYAASNIISLSDIEGLGTYWLGWLRFDFDLPILAPNTNYYFGLEPVTYTRNADVFYVGAAADVEPSPVNEIGTGNGGYLEMYERKVSGVCG